MELFREPTRYSAKVQLFDDNYPKVDKAEVIITHDGKDVTVGVKASYINMTREKDCILACSNLVGDYEVLCEDEPIHKLFEALSTVLGNVSELVEKGKQGKLNEGDNL